MKRGSDPLLAHLGDLLEPLGRLQARAMFGCQGIYCDSVFFALIAEGRLYLKTDAQTRDLFQAAGCAPFVYQGRGRAIKMSYWQVPKAAMDSEDEMLPWARLALAAALRKSAPAREASARPSRII